MDIAGRRSEAHPIATEVQNVFRAKAQEIFEPSDVNESHGISHLAGYVNRAVIEAAHGVRLAPAFVGCYNLALGLLTYHNASLLAVFRDAEGVRVLETGGIPMGLFTHCTYEPAFLAFKPDARLLLVTKGISLRRRGSATFGGERIRHLLENSNTDSASKICEAVLQEAHHFGSHSVSRVYDFLRPGRRRDRDDLTAVVLVRPKT
jgi:serine phosphatase RsbU (regulator of sigma subunit)